MNVNKLLGIAVGLAIVGLSLGDALTGHGIKGNKNLNPLIVGDGSNSNSSGSSGSSGSGSSGSSSSGSSSSTSGEGKCKTKTTVKYKTINGESVYDVSTHTCGIGQETFCYSGTLQHRYDSSGNELHPSGTLTKVTSGCQ